MSREPGAKESNAISLESIRQSLDAKSRSNSLSLSLGTSPSSAMIGAADQCKNYGGII